MIIKWICPSTDSSGLTLCSTTCLFCVLVLPPFLINLFCVFHWHSYSVRSANKLTMPKLNPPENVSLTRAIDRMTRMETQIYSIQDSNEVHGWGWEHLDAAHRGRPNDLKFKMTKMKMQQMMHSTWARLT